MHRVLFRVAGRAVYSYPVMLYVGLILGIAAGNLAAHSAHLDAVRVFIATLLLLIPTLLGARLFHVALNWGFYRCRPQRIWNRAEGGGALYGGLPLTLLLSVPVLDLFHLPFGAFWDVASFTILIGMMFTRVGCFLNGCCSGWATDSRFSIVSPNHLGIYARRVPTQLLEALWAAALLTGAVLLWNRLPFGGALFLCAIIGYAVGRWFLEGTREHQDRLGGVEMHQMISVLLGASALVVLIALWPG